MTNHPVFLTDLTFRNLKYLKVPGFSKISSIENFQLYGNRDPLFTAMHLFTGGSEAGSEAQCSEECHHMGKPLIHTIP